MKIILCFIIGLNLCFAQDKQVREIKINDFIEGSLYEANVNKDMPLLIISQGSGPTNRNGNQMMMISNYAKQLSDSLQQRGLNNFSYDKRTVKYIKEGKIPSDMAFENFVVDLVDVIKYFKSNGYTNIHLVGHSQGSLVSFKAAKIEAVESVISIAGTARTIDIVITEQVAGQYPTLKEALEKGFKELKATDTILKVNPFLQSVFAPKNQKFLNSYAQADPVDAVKALDDLPILVINGTKDIQVPLKDARALDSIAKNSKLIEIENMNHVYRLIEGDRSENVASYTNKDQAISSELVESIVKFVKQN